MSPRVRKGPKKKVLVICVDRDNDIGRKAGIAGPIIGKKDNINAATKLGLKDPSDSDINAIFKAVQLYEELRKKKDKVEIVTLTGDMDVGLSSDREITAQLEKVLKRNSVEEAILVSDGDADEHVLPILKARIRLVYPQKIIVKQSPQLEGMYYMIYDFIHSILSDPKASRLFLGLPAIALILYALFGYNGWRLIIGVSGTYLLIKGFQLEPLVGNAIKEMNFSIRQSKYAFFMYLVSAAFLVLGLFNGYKSIMLSSSESLVMFVALFISESILFFFVSAISIGLANMVRHGRKMAAGYLTYFVLCFSVAWIIYNVTEFIISPEIGYYSVIFAIAISGILIGLSNAFEKKTNKKK